MTMEKTAYRRRRRVSRDTGFGKALRYALALALMLIALGAFFRVNSIQVEGNTLYSMGEIVAASQLREGGSLFLTPRRQAAARICAGLACVERAEVSFHLPDRVLIRVTEGAAVAALECGGQWARVSSGGKVLALGSRAEAEGLTELLGLKPLAAEAGTFLVLDEVESVKLKYLTELLTLLEEKGMIASVQSIDISNASELRFAYEGRFQVRLGNSERLGYKLDFLARIAASFTEGEKGTIDLSTDMEGHYIPN